MICYLWHLNTSHNRATWPVSNSFTKMTPKTAVTVEVKLFSEADYIRAFLRPSINAHMYCQFVCAWLTKPEMMRKRVGWGVSMMNWIIQCCKLASRSHASFTLCFACSHDFCNVLVCLSTCPSYLVQNQPHDSWYSQPDFESTMSLERVDF